MSDELKPCPFCGGEAVIFDGQGNCLDYTSIQCSDCDVEIKEYLIDFSKDDMVNKWNSRRYENQQLAAAKAEIAELTNSIKLVLEWGYDSSDAVEAIEEIITEQLAKHEGE